MRVAVLAMVLSVVGVAAEAQQAVEKTTETTVALEPLYAKGRTWEQFRGDVRRRADTWKRNTEAAAVDPALLARARAIAGTWRILAVAIDACSDSASTVPYVARLVEQVPSLALRIVDSSEGRALMEAHRTPDGRAATPTLVLLDERGGLAGCWIERPAALLAWLETEKANPTSDEGLSRKMTWYDQDKGGETLREIVEMIEAAAAGRPVCPYPSR